MTKIRISSLSLILFFICDLSFSQNTDKNILDSYRWNNRILIIFTPSSNNSNFKKAEDLLKQNNDGILDRDLVIFYIFENSQSTVNNLPINKFTSNYLREKFYAANGKSTYILVGKDGGEKLRTTGQFNVERLFERIDELPMRQSEIEERTFSFDSIKFE